MMRMPLIALLLSSSLMPLLKAQTPEGEDEIVQAVKEPIGRLTWDTTAQMVDEIPQGSTHEFVFPFQVDGPGGIRILGVHEDCGCLTSSVQAGQVLEPGSKGLVKVELDTQAFSGPIDKQVILLTNEDRQSRVHRLRVRAKIKQTISIEPPLISFDWKGKNAQPEAILRVSGAERQGLHIEKIDYNLDLLDVAYRQINDAWEVKVKWKGPQPAQPVQEFLRITGDKGNWSVPVLGGAAR